MQLSPIEYRFHLHEDLKKVLWDLIPLCFGKKIPFVNEHLTIKNAKNILSNKKLGVLIVQNKQKKTKGIITDGQLRRFNQKNLNLHSKKVKDIMTKNPVGVDKDMLLSLIHI